MKIRKILSSILAVLMTVSCFSAVSFASETESTEKLVTISYIHSTQGMASDGSGKVTTTDEFGRSITRYYGDTESSRNLCPGGSFGDESTGAYKAMKVVYRTNGDTAPTLIHYTTDNATLTSTATYKYTHTANQWNVVYFTLDHLKMFQIKCGKSSTGEYLDVAYIAAFATMDEAVAHTVADFEGNFTIISAKAGANALTIANGVATYDLAGAAAVPELVITATGNTNGITIENGKLTATSDGEATSYVKNGDETILTVNFTGGVYAPVEPAELTAAAATSITDFDNIENYRVISSSAEDDFGRTINTYKPLWYYFTEVGGQTTDKYFSGNLRANVEVPSTVTKENYKTVKLVYRSTSTEVPTLASGTKTYTATNATSVAANEWNTLYYDYTELSAADSFIINLTEGTDPEEYKDETWEIGYLGLMEDATAAQAHISAFEGEFAVTDVLLDGTSIGNVTTYTQALDGAKDVPKLTVKATGDTSKVTITNGTIDGDGNATSKVTDDGTDIVVVSFTGGDAAFRVTDILVDGKSIGSFDAATASYTFDLGFGAVQPAVTYTFAGAEKELTISTVSDKDQNDLVSKYTVTIADGETVLYTLVFNVDTSLDSRLVNTLYRLKVDKELNVSYFGGSVTNGKYREYVGQWLVDNYGPETATGATINNINSAIGGSGSIYGVHRFKEHVVEYMESQITSTTAKSKKPDLIFIEFAINDNYDAIRVDGSSFTMAHSDQNYVNIESLVRQVYAVNPKADIIFVITGDYSRLKSELGSDTPVFGAQYTNIAEHYDIPILYVGRELVLDVFYQNGVNTYPATQQSTEYTDVWLKYFTDIVHPTALGGQHYADTITEYLAEDLPTTFTPAEKDYVDKVMPATVYCTENNKGDLILDADLVDAENIDKTYVGGYSVVSSSVGNRHKDYAITSNTAGDVMTFEFQASNLWLWCWGYSDEAELVYTIDGGEPQSVKFRIGSANHMAIKLAGGLDNAKTHTIRLYHNNANLVDIRNIMLSGLPEGATATITPVAYFDMATEEYTVKVGGEIFDDFTPAVTSYEIGVDSLAEGEGYPEIAFDCRDTYYGYTISQADLAAGDNTAELTIDNVATYTFSFVIGDAVEVDSIVKESGYKSGDAKAVLKAAAEYPVQLKAADAEWTDADAITTYDAGVTELTGLTAGEYTIRYAIAEGNYGSTTTFRIWNTYPTENVYYVSDNGTGDGSSPEKAAAAGGTIKSVITAASTYFIAKLGESNLADATCYIALVGDVTHGTNVTGLETFCKELVITGEYGSSFNMKKRIVHSLVSESAGKLIWRDVPVVLGDPESPTSEIFYGMMGNEIEFDNFYLKSYVSGRSSGIELLVFAPSSSSDTPVPGKLMTIDTETSPFGAIRYSNFNRAVYSGYINLEYNSGKVGTVALGGRGGTSGAVVHASDFNTASKITVNGGVITDLYISGSNKYGTSRGTLAAIINDGTVTNVKVVESGSFVQGGSYNSTGEAWVEGTSSGNKYTYSDATTTATGENTDRVIIFNNGTTAASIEKTNLDYIINSAVGGSVDITTETDTESANLYRLTGFTFTTNKSSVVIKNGDETVKTLAVTGGKASVTTAELAAGEYTITYENPIGIASIGAKIKLGRGADKAASANNGLKLEIRKADGTVLKTITLEDANTVTDADGYITVNLQADVSDITEDNITIVAVKNGYAPYSKTTTTAELVSALEAFFEEVDDNFEKGHGDIKSSYDDDCGDGRVDFDDFVRVIRGFNRPEGGSDEYDKYAAAVDLDEDGVITVSDLDIIKGNFGYGTESAE